MNDFRPSESTKTVDGNDRDSETLTRELAWRGRGPRLWFLLPTRLGRARPWLAGGAMAVLVSALYVTLTVALHGAEDAPTLLAASGVPATAGFFVASLGLLAGLAQVVFPAARQDLDELRAIDTTSPVDLSGIGDSLERLPRQSAFAVLPVALAFAAAHIWLLEPSSPDLGPQLAGNICNMLLWVAMFQISVPLVHNARLFSLLGHCSDIDLYRTAQLAPFGRSAIRPCLFIIALQCAYALLVFPENTQFSAGTAIGLMASMMLVAALFFMPLRGIRSRIHQRRREMIAALDERLKDLPRPDQSEAESHRVAQAAALLALRERIEGVSGWPLGLEGTRRLFFYIVLVPLTWVGAALVQMLVEAGL